MKKAVIGIGSNSVRMLLCDIQDDGAAQRLARDRAGTRLFAGLNEERALAPSAMEKTAEAVADMADKARGAGAADVRLFATSATRDAANAADFARLLRQRTGLELEVISGEEEAVLSFFGASGGGRAGVIDIGGGSTELVVGEGRRIDLALSCQMGAVRLFERLPISNEEETQPVVAAAAAILAETKPRWAGISRPQAWWGTGGTFTCLASLVNGTAWDDRSHTHGTLLTLADVTRLQGELAGMSVAERRRLATLQPGRADIVVHGICILRACMTELGIPQIRVSEYGNLDGYFRVRLGVRFDA